jgi:hypothetical protein
MFTLAFLLISSCSGRSETAIQDAEVGDVLVVAGGTKVELAKNFKSGVSNGLYKGAVRVSRDGQESEAQLYSINAVCSLKGEAGWPNYDNLYGSLINEPGQAEKATLENRWQILYYFHGAVESTGILSAEAWHERLKNNLCRREEFNDSTAKRNSSTTSLRIRTRGEKTELPQKHALALADDTIFIDKITDTMYY